MVFLILAHCGGACSPHLPEVSCHFRVVVKAFASGQCGPGSILGRSWRWSDFNNPPKHLNFNNDGDAHNEKLISPLTRVTKTSEIPAIKFLGVFIDPLLNFKFHIDTLIGKISKSMYFLRCVKHVLTVPALKSVYYSTIHSHFIYAIHIWSCSNLSNLNRLFAKQKMALRIVTNSSFNAHTEPL